MGVEVVVSMSGTRCRKKKKKIQSLALELESSLG